MPNKRSLPTLALKYLRNRLGEASSLAGFAAMLTAFGLPPDTASVFAKAVIYAAGAGAIIIPERAN